jgi:hypothetical protein
MRELLAEPMPVDVVRDAWDWVGFLVAAVSAVVGSVALIYAVRATREATSARQAVANERRRTFELGVLRDLGDATRMLWPEKMDHLKFVRRVGPLLALLPLADLPTLRRIQRLQRDEPGSDDDEFAAWQEARAAIAREMSPPDEARRKILGEIRVAVRTRMLERD